MNKNKIGVDKFPKMVYISKCDGQNKQIKCKGVKDMKKYICTVCGYIYDPEEGDADGGVAPGTAFEDLTEDWVCPLCGVSKDEFEEYAE